MAVKYISKDTAVLYTASTGEKKIVELLWGDHVTVLEQGAARSKVRTRGKTGFVKNSALGDTALLEIYFIDVGQGDGILICTPDNRHILIDGGYMRAKQPTRKSAADFVDWKFAKEYGQKVIHLDAMMTSHNDADHYGGLFDLLNVGENDDLDAEDIRVDAFYHAGVGWWINPANGERWLGTSSPDKKFMTQLMGDRPQVVEALKPNAIPKLQGEWADFMQKVTQVKTPDGSATPIRRLSHLNGTVPGFDGGNGGVAIRILAPVEFQMDGQSALHKYGSADSVNTNGNSLLLRLDYKQARILLTGDLNMDSQKDLLNDYSGNRLEFQCDVTKACHHGSDEVSYEFLNTLHPAVTVISSGDNEGHDHPRPGIVAASATTGYLLIQDDQIVSPLIYSTELARSTELGEPIRAEIKNPSGDIVVEQPDLGKVTVKADVVKVGDLKPTTKAKRLDDAYIVTGLIYGLVNVRTDGKTILCATMNEKDHTWQVKKIKSRF